MKLILFLLCFSFNLHAQLAPSDAQQFETNFLKNSSFENGKTGWTNSAGTWTISRTAGDINNLFSASKVVLSAQTLSHQGCFTAPQGINPIMQLTANVNVPTAITTARMCVSVAGVKTCGDTIVGRTGYQPVVVNFSATGGATTCAVFETTAAATGTVLSSSYKFRQGISTIASFPLDSGWTSCGLTTADFQGFGTVSTIGDRCKRDGPDLLMDVKFTAGTVSAAEARVNMRLSGVLLTSVGTSGIPSLSYAGKLTSNNSSATAIHINTYKEPNTSYVVFGGKQTSQSELNKMNGNDYLVTGQIVSFSARVPILGWEAFTNASIAGCVDAVGCSEDMDAVVTAGVVSKDTLGYLTSCTAFSGGNATCIPKTGVFPTQAPNCSATAMSGGGVVLAVTATTTSLITINATDINGAASGGTFRLTCKKTGVDLKPKTVVVSPLQGYTRVPGGENLNIDTFSVSYGTTNATTVCSASPCSYLDQIGTAVTSITRTTTGRYVLNASKTYTKLKCLAGFSATSNAYAQNLQCSNCSTLGIDSVITTVGGGYADANGTVMCQGTY